MGIRGAPVTRPARSARQDVSTGATGSSGRTIGAVWLCTLHRMRLTMRAKRGVMVRGAVCAVGAEGGQERFVVPGTRACGVGNSHRAKRALIVSRPAFSARQDVSTGAAEGQGARGAVAQRAEGAVLLRVLQRVQGPARV